MIAENGRALRAEYEAAHAEKMADYQSLQEERAEARRQRHLTFARNTAWQMVGFAEQAIQYREDTDGAKVTKALNRSMPCCAQQMTRSALGVICVWRSHSTASAAYTHAF